MGLDDLTPRQWELVHTTYAQAMESLERNEEMGERRLQLLFTVASAGAVAVGLVATGGATIPVVLGTAAGLSLAVGLLGVLIVRRLVTRNLATTRLKNRLAKIRRRASIGCSELPSLFVYDPSEPDEVREQPWAPGKGGLVDIAGCATAAFMAASSLFAGLAFEHPARWVVPIGIAVGAAVWVVQVFLIRRRYRKARGR